MEKIFSYSSTTLCTHSLNAASVCMVLPPHYVCYISCMHFIVHSYRADWGRANCWGGWYYLWSYILVILFGLLVYTRKKSP